MQKRNGHKRQMPKDPALAIKRWQRKRRQVEFFVRRQKRRGEWTLD